MKKLFLAITLLLILAACGGKEKTEPAHEENTDQDTLQEQTSANEEEMEEDIVETTDDGDRLADDVETTEAEQDEYTFPTVEYEEINQLGGEKFTDVFTEVPQEIVMDKENEYTYVMFSYYEADQYHDVPSEAYLSILKDNEWIVKDKSIVVGEIAQSLHVKLLGQDLIYCLDDETNCQLLTYNEKGEVAEAKDLGVKEGAGGFLEATGLHHIRTNEGLSVSFSSNDVFLNPSTKELVSNPKFLSDYVDFENNMLYYEEDGYVSFYDLVSGQVIYDEFSGQEFTVKIENGQRPKIAGQTKYGDIYVVNDLTRGAVTAEYQGTLNIEIYNEVFTPLNDAPVTIYGAGNNGVTIYEANMINEDFYLYEAYLFMGELSIRTLKFS